MTAARRVFLLNRYFHPDQSATAQLLTDLAQTLACSREVVVFCSRQLLEDAGANLPADGQLGDVRICRLWSTAWGRRGLAGRALDYLSFLLSVWIALLLRLRPGDVVIAKTDPPLLGAIAVLASLGRRVDVVHWLQDLYPETAWRLGIAREHSISGRLLRGLRNWSLRRGRLTVAVSQSMCAYLEGEAGFRGALVISNWADDLKHAAVSSYRVDLALKDRFVVGYSGNLGRAHPIHALEGLSERFRDTDSCHFLFTGGGAHMEMLRAHVISRKIPNWSFLPYQPRANLPELMSAADVHLVLLDSRLECFVFPSKFYGVLSAGRPVLHLGNPKGEIAALLRHHRCGWTVAADDLDGVANRLIWLRDNPQERLTAGRNARNAYEHNYTRTLALDRWKAALATLAP